MKNKIISKKKFLKLNNKISKNLFTKKKYLSLYKSFLKKTYRFFLPKIRNTAIKFEFINNGHGGWISDPTLPIHPPPRQIRIEITLAAAIARNG